MSGTVIRVIEDYTYDFSDLGPGTTVPSSQAVTVAQRIDTSQYREGGLLVRIFKFNLQDPTNDDVAISVVDDPWDPLSGSTVFSPPSNVDAPVAVSSLNPKGTSAPPTDPYSMWFPLTSPFGALLQVGLLGVRGSGTQGNSISIQLNADLILKD